ncbi:MAG: L-2-hydroxyglutarate oxidase [Chloroflexota bacterium]|nr:L-2-hydroxyglutarate oxidase [Chloroflexota bacterium]
MNDATAADAPMIPGGGPCDVAVIGGGIIGLATALALVQRFDGLSVVVIEKEPDVGRHQTGHNSGVIHSGLYYRPGSAKARLAVRGAEQMLAFCREHDIPHERCGKVVVATDESQTGRLRALAERGTANGVPGIREIGPGELAELEPAARGVRALHVPSTGIADYDAVTQRYRALVEAKDGVVRTGVAVTGLHAGADGLRVDTTAGSLEARHLVNCAGLMADRVARLAGFRPGLRIVPFRGEYYTLRLQAAGLVRNLIYPVPDPNFPFLGVHFTRRVDGTVEAGPNAVLALRREGYRWRDIDAGDVWDALSFPGFQRLALRYWRTGLGEVYRSVSRRAFTRALQALVPGVRAGDLVRAGAGVRAQALDRDGGLVDDFRLIAEAGMIHVLNAPSPGATASLGIGQEIAAMADDWFRIPRPSQPARAGR